MCSHLSLLGHLILALNHDLDLLADIRQVTDDLLVAIHESEDGVRDLGLLTELLDKSLTSPQVVAGHTGKEVVHSLELQTAVIPVEPLRAVDIHGGSQLGLGKCLGLAAIRRRHTPVGQVDLAVERHEDDVRDDDKDNAVEPSRNGAPDKAVAKGVPVKGHTDNLGRTNPPSLATTETRRLLREDMQPRQHVEVETSHGHDGIVHVVLDGNKDLARSVPDKLEAFVVRGNDGLEELGADGEEGYVLDIGIMLLMSC